MRLVLVNGSGGKRKIDRNGMSKRRMELKKTKRRENDGEDEVMTGIAGGRRKYEN